MRSAIIAGAFTVSAALAGDSLPKISFSGWGWLTIGQVVSSISEKSLGQAYDFEFDNEWLLNFEAGLKVVAPVARHSKGRLHVMTSLQYPVLRNQTGLSTAEPVIKRFSFWLLDATLQSDWGVFGGRDTIETEFGYLPVKYNAQSRNLGEYLFRSGTYPGYLVSGFELADKVKLMGVHLSYKLNVWGSLKAEVYFTNDMDVYPVHDFSLSPLLSFRTPHGLIDLGGGACFAHLIVVDPKRTTPANNKDAYPFPGDAHAYYVDTLPPYDTTALTFRGTKLMGRLAIDPKALIPWKGFGTEDLKLYGEVALLGVKNYPGWYANRSERIPVMFGINVPTFKLLDVLAFEGEWYGLKYWNTPEFVWREFTPRPYTGSTALYSYGWTPKTDDDWRWSIYASKKIGKAIRISAQAASDHMSRLPWVPSQYPKYTEICTRSRDWYYMGRVMWMF